MSKSSSEEENDHLPTNNEKKDESDAWLASETTWTKLKYNDTGAGWREEYRCNKVPYRNIQSRAVISSLHNYPTILLASDISIIQAVVQLTRRWQKVAKMIKMK